MDFKQKENKYLEEFLDMKQLKEKVKDKLYKQDQSLQTVHMLCKPKPFYDEKKKVPIGYKNPLYLTKAKQVQHALYNGHELVKTTHAPAIVHDSKDTLELAETTRMKMLEKSKILVNSFTKASESKPRSNTKNNRILPAKSDNKKKVEAHPRNNKSKLKQENRVENSISSKRTVINSNSKYVCKTCNKCLISANHDKCVVKYLKSINAPHVKNVLSKVQQVWKATGKLFAHVSYQWKPTGRKFTLREQCPLARFAMSSDNASSAVTYTSVSSDSNRPSTWGIPLVNIGELLEMDPYEEVVQQGQAHPLSPAYVPDPIKLDEHVPVYVPKPEHLEYHTPSDDDIQVENQPYAEDASPTAKLPGYLANSDSMEEDIDADSINYPDKPDDGEEDDDDDPEEDPSEEHGPKDDDDDDDTDDEDEEPTEDKEEEEHPALADSSVVPVVDPIPLAGDTEAFETDESAPTPRSP
ncbi:hypothetical protein Tco_0004141 [Tanacetum coccineum]